MLFHNYHLSSISKYNLTIFSSFPLKNNTGVNGESCWWHRQLKPCEILSLSAKLHNWLLHSAYNFMHMYTYLLHMHAFRWVRASLQVKMNIYINLYANHTFQSRQKLVTKFTAKINTVTDKSKQRQLQIQVIRSMGKWKICGKSGKIMQYVKSISTPYTTNDSRTY